MGFKWIMALLVTVLVCAIVLVMTARIQRLLSERIAMVIEKLMNLILIAIAIAVLLPRIKTLATQIP